MHSRHPITALLPLALIAAAWLLAPVAATPATADWTFLRGPAFNGSAPSSEALTLPWPDSSPPLLWERPLGQGYSAVTVSGTRAYTLYQSAFSQNLICLDAATGATIWEFPCGPPYEQLGLYPGPRSTPTLAGDLVLFVTPEATLHAVDAVSGKGRWSVDLKTTFQGKGTEFGYSASPLVFEDRVILPVGGAEAGVVAFRLADGSVDWKTGSQPASYASTVPIRLAGRTLLLTALRNHLVIHDPRTGRLVWANEVSQGYDEHSIAPLYEEPILVLTAPFKAGATAFTLSIAEGEGTDSWQVKADHRWHTREFSNDVVASVIHHGTIYGFDLRDQQAKAHRASRGVFRALDLPTGKTLWSSDKPGHSNVLAVGGKLLLLNDEGELLVVSANRDRYEELARTRVFDGEICWTFPTLNDGRVYLRSPSRIAAFQVGPDPSHQAEAAAPGSSAPFVAPRRSIWSRFRLGMLLGGEREHPFMQPALDELLRWYWASITTVAAPAALVGWWLRRRGRGVGADRAKGNERDVAAPSDEARSPALRGQLIEAGVWIGLGLLMTPVLSGWLERNIAGVDEGQSFVLTWPAALFGGLMLVMAAGAAESRWKRRAGDAAFLGLCLFYFLVLRSQSLPHEWAFLIGLVPALPFAWGWNRLRATGARPRLATLLTFVGFTVLFWTPLLLRLFRASIEVLE